MTDPNVPPATPHKSARAPAPASASASAPNRARQTSVVVVWLFAVVGAVLIGLLAGHETYIDWMVMAMGASVIVTLCIQLGIRRPEGFLARVTASMIGSVVVFAATTGILLIVSASG